MSPPRARTARARQNQRWRTRLCVAALGLMAFAGPGRGNVDCGAAHKAALEKLRNEQATTPPERYAAMVRRAQRAYEACRTGDVHDAGRLFERLDRLNR